jgi:hypothetical protein
MPGRSNGLSSVFGPDASTGLRVGGGVAGIAEASVAPAGAQGMGLGHGWLDTSSPAFWVAAYFAGSVAWLLWLRFVFRGAAL